MRLRVLMRACIRLLSVQDKSPHLIPQYTPAGSQPFPTVPPLQERRLITSRAEAGSGIHQTVITSQQLLQWQNWFKSF
jgi:hypothetical protein